MKKIIVTSILVFLTLACKTEKPKEETDIQETSKFEEFPEDLVKVFNKHGGLLNWNKINTLSYQLNQEKHTVDLHSRKTLIISENYSLGYDGKEVWIDTKNENTFKKDPIFYYNLNFYFFAMPFVLADPGIIYKPIAPLNHDGIAYPGIKISYQSDIGTSPEDNYFIYYHPKTFQMEWLGYTVTYFNKKTSKKIKMIRYDNWELTNGFLLPTTITWYKKDKDQYTPINKTRTFSSVILEETQRPENYYNSRK